jgi:glycosyltransferase involved in cell wall biosynthesis
VRVLQVSNTYPPADISGVGTLVAELHAQLLAGGHRSGVLTRRAPAAEGVVAVGGPKLLFPWTAAWRYLGLARAAGSERFDVVHVHESDGVLVAAAVRALRALRAQGHSGGRPRLLATLQVSYTRERRAVRAVRAGGALNRVVSRPVASERVFKWLRAPLLSALGRMTVRLVDGVVAPSRATAAELRSDYGAREVAVIPNGVAASAVGDRSLAARSGTVLFVGRLRTRKAVAVLVEAWAEVAREFPAARLVLLGAGEQRDQLLAQVERLRLGESVRLAGAVPRAEIDQWLRTADIFCLPSTYEGFPLAILEAMGQGLPVVATTVAGVPEAVDDGHTGLLVPPEDAPALAAALGRLLRDPELGRGMGRRGRSVLVERFAISRICAGYLELWAASGRAEGSDPNRSP